MAGQTERLPILLALFHTCFNITNTAILIGFIPQIERLVCWILPDKQEKEEPFRLQYIQTNLMQTPEIALLQAQKEIQRFSDSVCVMFSDVEKLFKEEDGKQFNELFTHIQNEEETTDRMEIEIARFLEQVGNGHVSSETKGKIRQMMRQIGELESVGDSCYNLARTLNRRQERGRKFSAEQQERVQSMINLSYEALNQMSKVMNGYSEELNANETYRIDNEIGKMHDLQKEYNIKAVNDRAYDYTVGSLFGDLVEEFQNLGDYIVNVVEARLGI